MMLPASDNTTDMMASVTPSAVFVAVCGCWVIMRIVESVPRVIGIIISLGVDC